jgi:hypothetical protein
MFLRRIFLAKNVPAKNFPPIRKKIQGEEFSGEKFLTKNVPAKNFLTEECTGEESS